MNGTQAIVRIASGALGSSIWCLLLTNELGFTCTAGTGNRRLLQITTRTQSTTSQTTTEIKQNIQRFRGWWSVLVIQLGSPSLNVVRRCLRILCASKWSFHFQNKSMSNITIFNLLSPALTREPICFSYLYEPPFTHFHVVSYCRPIQYKTFASFFRKSWKHPVILSYGCLFTERLLE